MNNISNFKTPKIKGQDFLNILCLTTLSKSHHKYHKLRLFLFPSKLITFFLSLKTMSSPSDWPQFYHQNLSNQQIFGTSEATGVVSTTTITSPSSGGPTSLSSVVPAAASSSGGGGGGGGGHLSPEGRVGKPVRRRSRASRRTPTTLLNTDTANFRAMVQQFTGSPTAPFANPGGGPTNLGFSFGGRHQALVNPGSLMVPPGGGFHLQYQQQQQQFQQPHQNQPYMFSLNSNSNIPGGGGAAELFFQRLGGNPRPNMEGAAGGGVEGVSSSQIPPRNNFLQ